MEIFLTIYNILSGLLLTFLIIKVYYCYIYDSQIDFLLKTHYKNQKTNVIAIHKLNLKEKIRYGVPLNSFIRFYGYIFTFFSLKTKTIRKVEITDRSNNEITKYIEMVVKQRKLISVKEFDSYDI